MRVLIVNTNERTGGAAIAANRLMEALNNHGVKAKMLVSEKQSDRLTVVGLPPSLRLRWHFLWERLVIFFHTHFSREHLFEIDIANTGTDITRLPEFQEADIIHLHWINQGMLALSDIKKILRSGKPVVWTMHDIWPATAICHLTLHCKNYKSRCHHCRLLPGGGGANDLAATTWRRKEQMLRDQNIFFVACSRWLAAEAKSSALLGGQKITSIPNPIDTRIYRPKDKAEARRAYGLPADKKLLLFVAQRATNRNKGMDYLVEACKTLASTYSDTLGVIVLGGHADEVINDFSLPVYPLGYISSDDELAKIYSAADVFVLPSLSENLPNTIMEAMACGVPCVGFNVGGIPEEIDHRQNGYVAQYRDAADLAHGIEWVLGKADAADLRQQCLRKVAHNYSQSAVALRYVEVYNQALALKHYKL